VRKLLVLLLLLVVLAVTADVLARRTAEDQVAERLRRTLDLSSDPEVSMDGMPFLADLFRGDISRIVMSSDDVRSPDVTFDDVEIEMRNVRFSLGDVVDGTGRVTVKRGEGRAEISEGNLNDALAEAGAPFTIALTSQGVTASSEQAGVEASGNVTVQDNALAVGAEGLSSVPLQLPSLGGRVSYESVSLADGKATLEFSISELSLTP
jgi:hypothetical protein